MDSSDHGVSVMENETGTCVLIKPEEDFDIDFEPEDVVCKENGQKFHDESDIDIDPGYDFQNQDPVGSPIPICKIEGQMEEGSPIIKTDGPLPACCANCERLLKSRSLNPSSIPGNPKLSHAKALSAVFNREIPDVPKMNFYICSSCSKLLRTCVSVLITLQGRKLKFAQRGKSGSLVESFILEAKLHGGPQNSFPAMTRGQARTSSETAEQRDNDNSGLENMQGPCRVQTRPVTTKILKKRHMTPYVLFTREEGPRIFAKYKGKSFAYIAKEVGRNWRELDAVTKDKYRKMSTTTAIIEQKELVLRRSSRHSTPGMQTTTETEEFDTEIREDMEECKASEEAEKTVHENKDTATFEVVIM